jgi:hypothetical protein
LKNEENANRRSHARLAVKRIKEDKAGTAGYVAHYWISGTAWWGIEASGQSPSGFEALS